MAETYQRAALSAGHNTSAVCTSCRTRATPSSTAASKGGESRDSSRPAEHHLRIDRCGWHHGLVCRGGLLAPHALRADQRLPFLLVRQGGALTALQRRGAGPAGALELLLALAVHGDTANTAAGDWRHSLRPCGLFTPLPPTPPGHRHGLRCELAARRHHRSSPARARRARPRIPHMCGLR
eukprot:scaffold1_cov402-Prasinococcus_capsulatus_cf.AAC.2